MMSSRRSSNLGALGFGGPLLVSSSSFQRSLPSSPSMMPCSTINPSSSSPLSTTTTTAAATLSAIENSGVIACLRAQSGELAMEAAQAALNGGISILEITMTTPGVLEVLQVLVQQYPTSILGAGTVLDATDAKNAIKAGAKFLMSPAMVMKILDDVQDTEVLYIPGVMTPTEVLTAYNAGAKIVKVYPVSVLGGCRYISALKKPFSHIPMVASQGITIDLIGTYIDQGASSVVLSDAIFEKEAMSKRNYDKIRDLACLAAARSREAKRRGTMVQELLLDKGLLKGVEKEEPVCSLLKKNSLVLTSSEEEIEKKRRPKIK